MKNYILSAEELSDFADEEKRREIRLAVAQLHTTADTVIIQDEDGNIFDNVKGLIPSDEPEEIKVPEGEGDWDISPETAEFRRLVEAVDPEVLAAITARAEKEVRNAIDETAAENARLKAENATLSRVLSKLRDKLQTMGIDTVINDQDSETSPFPLPTEEEAKEAIRLEGERLNPPDLSEPPDDEEEEEQ